MSDVSSLLITGWKNLWKAKAVWGFSLIPYITMPNIDSANGLLFACLNLVGGMLMIILNLIRQTGLTYSAFQVSAGVSVTFHETVLTIKRYWIKVDLFILLTLALLSPYFCPSIYFYLYNLHKPNSDFISVIFYLAFIPITVFSAMFEFPIIGIVAQDLGIKKSIDNAWKLFTLNFASLATIGLILTGISWGITVFVGMAVILIQSGLDFSSLTKLNYILPSLSLADSSLYQFINAITQTLVNSYQILVFTAAFLKYSGESRPRMIENTKAAQPLGEG